MGECPQRAPCLSKTPWGPCTPSLSGGWWWALDPRDHLPSPDQTRFVLYHPAVLRRSPHSPRLHPPEGLGKGQAGAQRAFCARPLPVRMGKLTVPDRVTGPNTEAGPPPTPALSQLEEPQDSRACPDSSPYHPAVLRRPPTAPACTLQGAAALLGPQHLPVQTSSRGSLEIPDHISSFFLRFLGP